MRLKSSNGWLDYDLNLYHDIARPIDLKIDELFKVITTDFSTADMFDYPLTVEHLLGVGLVAAQVYLVAAIGEQGASRQIALSIGPRHPSGAAVVQLINQGANFWKHADEWDYEVPDGRSRRDSSRFLGSWHHRGSLYPDRARHEHHRCYSTKANGVVAVLGGMAKCPGQGLSARQ